MLSAVCVYTRISDEASGGATRAPAPPTAMIYMEPGLSPGYRHEEEEEGKEGLEEAGGRRRGSQPWLRRFLASSLGVTTVDLLVFRYQIFPVEVSNACSQVRHFK